MIDPHTSRVLFESLQDLLFKYGRYVFDKTSLIFLSLFGAFYSVKLAWEIVYRTLIKREASLEHIMKPIVVICALSGMLASPDFIESWIVRPFYNLALHLTTVVVTGFEEFPNTLSIGEMLDLVDKTLSKTVFEPTHAASELVGWKVHLHLGILIIEALYVAVWFLFLAIIIDAIFRFLTFFALSPLIVVAAAFPQGKAIAIAGFRSILHGFLSMFIAGFAMGATIHIIENNKDKFGLGPDMSSTWVFSKQYLFLLLISLISILFHLKAPKISANLANIDDGPGAAAAVAGLGTSIMMSGKAMMMRGASHVGGSVGRHFGRKGGKVYDGMTNLLDSHLKNSLYNKITGK